EGNIWVSTDEGLDRFREFPVSTFTAKQGLSNSSLASVLADKDGSVWIATAGGLNRWQSGRFTIPQTGGAKRDGKLNGLAPHALFQDARGRIWVSTYGGVGYLENNRFSLSSVPMRNILSFTQGTGGNFSMIDADIGLVRLSAQSEVEQIPSARLGHKDL